MAGSETAVEADREDGTCVAQFLDAGGDPIEFFFRDAQGLFDEYVFAGAQRRDHEIRVKIVTGGDEDRGGGGVVPDFLGFGGGELESVALASAFGGDAFGGADAAPSDALQFSKRRAA